MEVKGGMDNITRIFAQNLRNPILTNAQVQSIDNTPDGVDVVYNHEGKRKKLSAAWFFNSIPAHLMVGIAQLLDGKRRDIGQGHSHAPPRPSTARGL